MPLALTEGSEWIGPVVILEESSSCLALTLLAPLSATSCSLRRPKKKKKKKKKEKKGASLRWGADSSRGDDKRIHGFEVSRIEIDKALAPAGLSSKDRASLVETAVEVAAPPGVFGDSLAGV